MPGRRGGYALLGLAALLLVVGVGSGISGASRLTARDDHADAVLAAATAFVETYGRYDASLADAYRPRLIGLTSGELRAALAEASVATDAARLQRSLWTEVESASMTGLSGDTATAHVVAIQQRRWVDAAMRTSHEATVRQHVAMRLVFEQGRWLVAELRLLSEASARPAGR